MGGAREQEQGVLRPAQQVEQSRWAIVVQQGLGVGSLLTRTWAGREACLSKMAAFVLMAYRTLRVVQVQLLKVSCSTVAQFRVRERAQSVR